MMPICRVPMSTMILFVVATACLLATVPHSSTAGPGPSTSSGAHPAVTLQATFTIEQAQAKAASPPAKKSVYTVPVGQVVALTDLIASPADGNCGIWTACVRGAGKLLACVYAPGDGSTTSYSHEPTGIAVPSGAVLELTLHSSAGSGSGPCTATVSALGYLMRN